ncbi:TPA: hypothetical protein IWO58_000515 [Enterococcus faecium]|nr:hypothetical protein [Enterococcus faecium]
MIKFNVTTQLGMDYQEQARFERTEFYALKFLGQNTYNNLITLGTLDYVGDNEFIVFGKGFRLGILADENGIKDIARFS